MDNLFTVIMAGGRGERLWPKSNDKSPKQFAKIVSEKTMLEETVERCQRFTPNQIYISILQSNLPILKKVLPGFPKSHIITEPMIRDTACAILLAALSVPAKDQDILVFLPADHYVRDLNKFKNDIMAAFRNTQKTGKVTLIGIPPNYPSSEYGYLKVSPSGSSNANRSKKDRILRVEKFIEKPNLRKAQAYFKNGQYLWNSGIFMFQRGYLLSLFQKHTLDLYTALTNYLKFKKAGKTTQAENVFKRIHKISFDYAIAEKISHVDCVRSTFFWDDVGSWESLFRIKPMDKQGNIVISQNHSHLEDSSGNLVLIDDNSQVVLNGVKDLIIASNDDTLYIAHRKNAGKIKSILKELKNEKKSKKN